jgi:hypothetical protein
MADDFVGPPSSHPEFDSWDEKKHKSAERAIEILDGIKSYKNAGGVGVGHKYKPHYVDLVRRGGLSPEEASMVARYKMWRAGKGTKTERVPEEPKEQIEARGAEFVKAPPERRGEMIREAEEHANDSYTRFYDDLIGDKKAPSKPQAQAETKKKEGA